MSIDSNISGVSDRAYDNAARAYLRDPRRSIRLLDFLTLRERQLLVFTSLGDMAFEAYLDRKKSDRDEYFGHLRSDNLGVGHNV